MAYGANRAIVLDVLVVTGDALLSEAIENALGDLACSTALASDDEDALRQVGGGVLPRVVLTEVEPRRFDARSFVGRLRALPGMQDVPVMAFGWAPELGALDDLPGVMSLPAPFADGSPMDALAQLVARRRAEG